MKKLTVPSVLILALTFGGCGQTEPLQVEEKVIPVETKAPVSGEIKRELTYAGQVKPIEQIYVTPKIGGKVVSAYYEVGDRVLKDAVLLEIDDTDIQSTIDTASAQYQASLSGIDTAKASLNSVAGAQSDTTALQLETAVKNTELALENTENVIATAEIGLENAEIALSNARLALNNITETYNSTKTLYDAGAVPKTEFDRVELSYNQAVAALEQAELAQKNALVSKEQALAAKNQAIVSNEQAKEQYDLFIAKTKSSSVSQAQSGVNQASSAAEVSRVALNNVVRTLEDLKIKSPISGVITAKNASVGGLVSQASPVYTIMDLDIVEIETNISEELINVVSLGMTVPVYISSVGEEPFDGVVTTISPAADEMKSTFPIKIEISNPNGILKPGMFAEVRFVKEKSENTIVLERNIVLSDETSKYVFVAENGIAKKYVVETGIDNGKEIEVLSGLPDNAMIIVKGQTLVSDGDKINIVNAGAQDAPLDEEDAQE